MFIFLQILLPSNHRNSREEGGEESRCKNMTNSGGGRRKRMRKCVRRSMYRGVQKIGTEKKKFAIS